MKKLVAALAAACLSAGSAQAYVITFNGAPLGAFGTASEGGFTVASLSSGLSIANRGIPAPSLLTGGAGTAFQVTSVTGLFTFQSFAVDLNSTDTDDSSGYAVSGFLSGVQLFTQGDSEFGGLGSSFATVASVSGLTIDRLVFTQTALNPRINPGLFFDNIDVTAVGAPPAGVPEPASWGLMLAGFGLVGRGLRARRQAATFAHA